MQERLISDHSTRRAGQSDLGVKRDYLKQSDPSSRETLRRKAYTNTEMDSFVSAHSSTRALSVLFPHLWLCHCSRCHFYGSPIVSVRSIWPFSMAHQLYQCRLFRLPGQMFVPALIVRLKFFATLRFFFIQGR